ncbi:L-asparaginase 1 isoform X2 [Diachasmimorpha longicaudata]
MAGNYPGTCVPTLEGKINGSVPKNGRSKSPDLELSYRGRPEGRVLVLYTGGTIGMIRNATTNALAPVPNQFVKTVKKYPHMYDSEFATKRFGSSGLLALPMTATESRRIIYDIREYSQLLDSSNMTMNDWIKIAKDIKDSYEFFDGFVVLHGTDTLSYTASALSFMLESLGKPVIITGSQLPIFDTRSDGLQNFLASLIIAGNYSIPEVCVFFGSALMRGNRTSKVSAASFEAFESPNVPKLATAGIKIQVDYQSIFRPCAMEKFHVHTTLNPNVGLLRIFPSITVELVRAFLQPPIEGVVLQTFGAGNIPINRDDIVQELRNATSRGVIVLNITQCCRDGVTPAYEPGTLLVDAGVTVGYDMTPEAALTKLSYVLSKTEWDIDKKRKMMETNLRGELTTCERVTFQDRQLFLDCLRLSTETELNRLGPIIFPAMLIEAVIAKDAEKLELLRRNSADISQPSPDGRTALHIACNVGDIDIVRKLLEMGANVHMKDLMNRTPLTEAIENHYDEIIKLLVQCGAHLHEDPLRIGEKLCSAGANGDVKTLLSLECAGANLNQANASGLTALQQAVIHDKPKALKFLLDHHVDSNVLNKRGLTPRQIAERLDCQEVLKLLPPYTTNSLET